MTIKHAARAIVAFTATAAMSLWVATAAFASELTILSGGAAKAVLQDVFPRAEAAGGFKIKAEFTPVGALMKRLEAGEKPDVVVITEDVLSAAKAKGLIVADTVTEVGRVGVGVAVKEGAPRPDISSPEAFKATILAAKSIVMIDPERGTSGKHLAAVFEQLGVAQQIWPKTVKLEGGFVVEKVATGEVELGLHQITEILPVKGITLVGPLPDAIQKVTVYVAAVVTGSPNTAQAKAFLSELKTDATKTALKSRGFFTN